MALQHENKKLAIKWGLALVNQGFSINEACKMSSEWYKLDPKEIKKGVLNI